MYAKADADHWKRKYFDALRALEQEERGFRALESLLRRFVSRLGVAATGQSEALDVEIRRLNEAMRRKAGEDELTPLFTSLSAAISALDAGPSRPLEERAGDVGSRTGDERLRLLLTRILAELHRDPGLAARVEPLERQLARPVAEGELEQVVGGIAELVSERIVRLEQDKADVERLLNQIGARLDEITRYVADEEQDRRATLESTQELDTRLTREMLELGQSMDSTLDIVQLKLKVRARLDAIGSHLQEFREREERRVRAHWERSENMRHRLEQVERESRELQERLRDEQRLALIDPLTQIPNRMAYDQRLVLEYARWMRTGEPLTLAAWDVDHFKRINDAYGHRAGDKVLRIVAETLAGMLRQTDFLGRYGGEEFVMILPNTDSEGALVIANRMREAVATLGFHYRGEPVPITTSCGLATLQPGEGADQAFERADKALYRAKEAGRNCCVLA